MEMSLSPRRNKEFNSQIRSRNAKMAIESFEIELEAENYKPWFRPGEYIHGKVILKNSAYIICRGIRVALEGTAVVSYFSEKSGLRRKKSENVLRYDGAPVYLLGGGYQGSHFLKRSRYEFPFSIRIRKSDPFPGTLAEPYGEIVYRVVAYLESASVYAPQPTMVSEIIRIRGHLNLRRITLPAYPVVLSGMARLSPSIEFTLRLSRTSFVFWERIPFILTLIDPPLWEMDCMPTVCVSLIRRITFRTDSSTKCTKTVLSVAEHSDWDFEDEETAEWKHYLKIPNEAKYPSFSGGIIQCIYSFKLEMSSDSCLYPYTGEVPITIGTTREL